MKKTIRHILPLLFLFLALSSISAQEKSCIDEDLNRYEALCSMCLDIKNRISEGEKISKGEAQALIGHFVAINHKIKQYEASMTASQKRRFDAVSQWFSTGVKPLSLIPAPEIDVVDFDYNVCVSESAPILLECRSVHNLHTLKSPAADTKINRRLSIYLLAGVTVPDVSYGFMTGAVYGRWGGYVNFKSNYVFINPSYSCFSNGTSENGWMFWPGDGARNSNLLATAGGLFAATDWLSVYLGAGYGHRKLYWEDSSALWAEVSDWSHSGFSSEAGAVFSWKKLALSIGISTISFHTATCSIGIGVSF